MGNHSIHSARDYHVLVVRMNLGFVWQIRYNKHAKPLEQSETTFATQYLAETEGQKALAAFRAALPPKP